MFKMRLKLRRISVRMRQMDLADIAGLRERKITHLETGRCEPTDKELLKICEALQCSVEELTSEKISMKYLCELPYKDTRVL